MKLELYKLVKIAVKAGEAILEVYNSDFSHEQKQDGTPVTAADRKASDVIVKQLKTLYPDIPVLSEEGKEISYKTRKAWEYFWLVDPLDGTKEFLSRNGEFTVNIALIHRDKPVLGVIYAPVLAIVYYAQKGNGAYRIESNKIADIVSDKQLIEYSSRLPLDFPDRPFTVVKSRSHISDDTLEYIETLQGTKGGVEIITKGSSLKFCMVAEGKADVYPRLGPTSEWDIAAAHIIVNEAGKKVYKYNSGCEVTYNKQELRNGWFVVKE